MDHARGTVAEAGSVGAEAPARRPAGRRPPVSGEIHAALTERVPSAVTDQVLERVGRTLGAREGTGPEDTPLLRSLGEHARAEELAAAVRSVLAARGIQMSDPHSAVAAAFGGVERDALLAAALNAVDEPEFHRRLEALRRC